MKLTGQMHIDVYDAGTRELAESFTVGASEFTLEETGIRHYDDEKGYRALFVYSSYQYGFNVLIELEEMRNRIIAFEYNVSNERTDFSADVSLDALNAWPSSGEYDDDDWY